MTLTYFTFYFILNLSNLLNKNKNYSIINISLHFKNCFTINSLEHHDAFYQITKAY